ncbi:phosphocholine-specific phospholipase C [Silvibacterium sp.]|uniref:phosphocholine-specific phospholipase C n=1 Tax=Silvibacterium sp. TaxID=1964179 RepID=UPI0039E3A803
MHTRRDFLKFAALATGAAGVAGIAPESIQRAYAIEPAPGSTWRDAEHIVILMQENRSFDHAFGTLRGVRGYNDPRALRLANGNSVFVQTEATGDSYAPWRLDIRDTRVTWMGSLPHSRESQVDAWNEGHHDGWLDAKRSGEKDYAPLPLTMGHYTREDLPFYYALADAFTVCDQNYCSVMTSTSPNRSYFWTGTIRPEQRADAGVHIRNEQLDYGGLTWKTFPERLSEAGIRWKSYQNDLARSPMSGEEESWLSNFGDNILESFNAYNVDAYPGFIPAGKRWLAEFTPYADKLKAGIAATSDPNAKAAMQKQLAVVQAQLDALSAAVANGGEAKYNQLTEEQKALFHAAFVTNAGDPDYRTLDTLPFKFEGQDKNIQVPKGDVLHQFRKDVNEGKLPTVSWLTASERFSDHPSSPWYGAWYISEVMDILTKNPEVWKKTIFILTYDENDGYFDHAPSYVAADPKRPETGGASEGIDTSLEYVYREDELRMGVDPNDARTGPIGMGYRVPMVIASPWSRGGYVNSQLFDHTSTLMFLERFVQEKYGKTPREENISSWRRAIAGDLTSTFRPHDPKEAHLDFVNRDTFVVSIAQARYREVPSGYTKLTAQQIDQINHAPHDSALLPQQEKGVRPSCALPYELHADFTLSADGTHCEVALSAKQASAPFNIYLRNLSDRSAGTAKNGMRAATYAVKAGDTLTVPYALDLFADGRYAIEVSGPNGFYRSVTGEAKTPQIEAHLGYEQKDGRPTSNAVMHLRNPSGASVSVTVTDNAYKAKPVTKSVAPSQQISVVLPLEQSHGWYDLTVTANGTEAARFAGRVETGKASISDPAMGGIA